MNTVINTDTCIWWINRVNACLWSSIILWPSAVLFSSTLLICLLLFSRSVMSDSVTPRTAVCQASLFFAISQSLLKLMSSESMMPSNHLVLCHPLLLLPSIFPSISLFNESMNHWTQWISPMNQLFSLGSQGIGASASARVLLINIKDRFPLGLTGLISLQSKGLQDSSPTPQFKSINCLSFSLLYGPTLTSIHDYWKNYSFDYTGLCSQNNVSAF